MRSLYGLDHLVGELFTDRQLGSPYHLLRLGEGRRGSAPKPTAAATPVWRMTVCPCGMVEQGATAYAEAVGVYLAFAVDKGANYWSTICAWHQSRYGSCLHVWETGHSDGLGLR